MVTTRCCPQTAAGEEQERRRCGWCGDKGGEFKYIIMMIGTSACSYFQEKRETVKTQIRSSKTLLGSGSPVPECNLHTPQPSGTPQCFCCRTQQQTVVLQVRPSKATVQYPWPVPASKSLHQQHCYYYVCVAAACWCKPTKRARSWGELGGSVRESSHAARFTPLQQHYSSYHIAQLPFSLSPAAELARCMCCAAGSQACKPAQIVTVWQSTSKTMVRQGEVYRHTAALGGLSTSSSKRQRPTCAGLAAAAADAQVSRGPQQVPATPGYSMCNTRHSTSQLLLLLLCLVSA